jgi:opacity protein-like surface antigen
MVRANFIALVGAAALVSTASLAADLPPPLLPPPPAPIVALNSGWYLRGDVGIGINHCSDFQHHQGNPNFIWPPDWQIVQCKLGDTNFLGFGAGYAWNNWFRFDFTGEYRTKADLKVIGSYTTGCPPDGFGAFVCFDNLQAEHSAWVALANAYVDLGTWWCLTPFVGVGVGGARHQFFGFTDTGMIANGFSALGFASDQSAQWKFAWAVHAGVAYNVTNNVKIELAYRYLNLGSVDTPNINCSAFGCGFAPQGQPSQPTFYTVNNFNSQEIKIGVRFLLTPPEPAPLYAPPPPVMRKG